jgi:hypothetical protein
MNGAKNGFARIETPRKTVNTINQTGTVKRSLRWEKDPM